MTIFNPFVPSTGSTRGAVAIPPERLLSFSKKPFGANGTAGSTASTLSGGSTGAPTPQNVMPGSADAAKVAAEAARHYRFRINPSDLAIRHEVLEKYVLTKFGYERQDWGNGLSTFQYTGTTGVFRPEVSAAEYMQRYPGGFDIRQTVAYKRFKEFETFYRTNRGQNVFMFYQEYDHEWEGSLSQFSFQKSANKPFHLDYSFVFTGMPLTYATVVVGTMPDSSLAQGIQQRAAGTSPALTAQGGTGSGTFGGGRTPPP